MIFTARSLLGDSQQGFYSILDVLEFFLKVWIFDDSRTAIDFTQGFLEFG